jgi:hypothetical protein
MLALPGIALAGLKLSGLKWHEWLLVGVLVAGGLAVYLLAGTVKTAWSNNAKLATSVGVLTTEAKQDAVTAIVTDSTVATYAVEKAEAQIKTEKQRKTFIHEYITPRLATPAKVTEDDGTYLGVVQPGGVVLPSFPAAAADHGIGVIAKRMRASASRARGDNSSQARPVDSPAAVRRK